MQIGMTDPGILDLDQRLARFEFGLTRDLVVLDGHLSSGLFKERPVGAIVPFSGGV
jgi:hypothetical protein